jgi:16S rRNA (guanine527-N7)-methyltransferase
MAFKQSVLQELPQWQKFITHFKLSETQQKQFARYFELLSEYNELFNLTAIIQPSEIVAYHFQDSLALSQFVDFNAIQMIADVGSGAGFPGIPLKIMYPHLDVILIEVTKKKIEFLELVCAELDLDNILTMDIDWRTFLRKTDEPIDLFVSRASLHPDELIRMFKGNCPYRTKQVVYWASTEWKIMASEQPFFEKEVTYKVGSKERRFIFFANAMLSERNK